MFWNKKKKTESAEERNKRLTQDVIRIKIKRLINGTPVGLATFEAQLVKDESNNTVMLNQDSFFKEELPGIKDSLISDILYKLESRGLNKDDQLKKVSEAISNQEQIVANQKNGWIEREVERDGQKVKEKVKINIITERTKLRLLKCVKYALVNLKGEGYFETIEEDGYRLLEYLVRDGELIPYWHKTPNDEGEPVVLVPDVVQRKKFFREANDENNKDFMEHNNTMWKGVLGTIVQVLLILFFVGNIIWSFNNVNWTKEINDGDEVARLAKEVNRVNLICNQAIATQTEQNKVFIDYAIMDIQERMEALRIKQEGKQQEMQI